MYDFECHYRTERWPTDRYFNVVEDFLLEAQYPNDSSDCDPPPCPTAVQDSTGAYATGEHLHARPPGSRPGVRLLLPSPSIIVELILLLFLCSI